MAEDEVKETEVHLKRDQLLKANDITLKRRMIEEKQFEVSIVIFSVKLLNPN